MVETQGLFLESFIYPTPHNYSSSSNGVDLRAHNLLGTNKNQKMAALRINFAALAFLVVLATSAVGTTSAATYVVRDSSGWGIPTNGGAASYSTWASQHTFRVGDLLVFNFPTGAHDLAIVSKAGYDGCLSSNPISLVTVGPATVNLSSPGEAYFICTFSQHCSLGQQLAINVISGTTPPPTSPPPAATPPPSTSPPTTTPAPAPPKPAPVPAPAKPGPTAPVPAPAKPGPTAPVPAPAPGTSGPSPAPGPGGGAPAPSPSVSPSPSPGSPEASPPPGETPSESLSPPAPPPPNAAPASVTATATIFVMFMSLAVVIFF